MNCEQRSEVRRKPTQKPWGSHSLEAEDGEEYFTNLSSSVSLMLFPRIQNNKSRHLHVNMIICKYVNCFYHNKQDILWIITYKTWIGFYPKFHGFHPTVRVRKWGTKRRNWYENVLMWTFCSHIKIIWQNLTFFIVLL